MKALKTFLEYKIDLPNNGPELNYSDFNYKYIESIVKKYKTEKDNVYIHKVYEGKSGDHYIAEIYGGLNGPGEWTDYLSTITNIIKEVKNCWIIDLINDCLDDVFVLRLGFRTKE